MPSPVSIYSYRARLDRTSPTRFIQSGLLDRSFGVFDLNPSEDGSEASSVLSDRSSSDEEPGLFSRSPSSIDFYRLAMRTHGEILEDLTAILRILRQMNTIHRIFLQNHPRQPALEEEWAEEDEETHTLLETGLNELQHILSTEHQRQSTLAMLSLLTHPQGDHACSERYLQHYLDPNGEYNPPLAILAAAIFDEEETQTGSPKSCQEMMTIAEDLLGPTWLDDFYKMKGCVLKKMLEKLALVAKIRVKVKEKSVEGVNR
ncbi:hypothetical protein BY458DRAFT_587642 [Sporodiniella umbellata]|nr:hypothetical protein BY458DRAFT_587642 [Sporodiniella umbellata]